MKIPACDILSIFIGILFMRASGVQGVNGEDPKIFLTHKCVNYTLFGTCTVDPACNGSVGWAIGPPTVDWESLIICQNSSEANETTNSTVMLSPDDLQIFRNKSLYCYVNCTDGKLISANVSLSAPCKRTNEDDNDRRWITINEKVGRYSVQIPAPVGKKLTVSLRKINRWLRTPDLRELLKGKQIYGFGSDILDVDATDENGHPFEQFTEEPVLLDFPIDSHDPEILEPICSFLDQETDVWSTSGCTIQFQTATDVQCSCNHLTHFAILFQTDEIPLGETDKLALEILTKIGLTLSIVCLAVTLLAYAVCRMRSLRTVIHANLAFALMASHLVFLFTGYAVDDGCSAVAIILHYFLLAAFTWMALEGVFLLIKSTPTFQRKIRMFVWFAVGWGFPVFIVVISLAANVDGYRSNPNCWLSYADGFVWAFLTPVIVIILINTAILIRLIYIFMSLRANKKKSEMDKMKSGLRLVLILEPLLGIPWLLGLLYFNPKTIFFAYVFVICNSTQGVLFFVTQCLFDEEVRRKIKIQMKSTKVISLTSSSHTQEKSTKQTSKSSVTANNINSARPTTKPKECFVAPRVDCHRGNAKKITRDKEQSDPVKLGVWNP